MNEPEGTGKLDPKQRAALQRRIDERRRPNQVRCHACGYWFQARKDGLPRGHGGPPGSECRSPTREGQMKAFDGDGTDKLCWALYVRRARPQDYLGGSEAKMLHDAAEVIDRVRQMFACFGPYWGPEVQRMEHGNEIVEHVNWLYRRLRI